MSTKLRISPNPYSVNIDFDDEEYREAVFTPVNKSNIHILDRRAPRVHDGINGITYPASTRLYYKLNINIFHKYSTTSGKVESLYSYVRDFKVYWQYADDATEIYYGILHPDFTRRYAFGQKKAEVVTSIEFYPVDSSNIPVY